MSSVVIAGNTSGSVTLQAPDVAGSTTISLPTVSGGTLVTTDASGNVGVGTSSPSGRFQVLGTAARITIDYASGGDNYYDAANQIFRSYAGAERMRIDSSGNVCIGTNAAINSGVISEVFNGQTVNGIALKTSWASTGSFYIQFWNSANSSAGVISQNGTTTVSYGTSSDYRLKENVQPMVGALNTVAKLKPVTYNWIVDGSEGQGFIAHELQEVVPDCVIGEKDAVYEDGSIKAQNVDTSFLVATLTAAIQEQQELIKQLQADVATLKGTV